MDDKRRGFQRGEKRRAAAVATFAQCLEADEEVTAIERIAYDLGLKVLKRGGVHRMDLASMVDTVGVSGMGVMNCHRFVVSRLPLQACVDAITTSFAIRARWFAREAAEEGSESGDNGEWNCVPAVVEGEAGSGSVSRVFRGELNTFWCTPQTSAHPEEVRELMNEGFRLSPKHTLIVFSEADGACHTVQRGFKPSAKVLAAETPQAALAASRPDLTLCHYCSASGSSTKLLTCGGCRSVNYCATPAGCQKVDWKFAHKAECKELSVLFERHQAVSPKKAHQDPGVPKSQSLGVSSGDLGVTRQGQCKVKQCVEVMIWDKDHGATADVVEDLTCFCLCIGRPQGDVDGPIGKVHPLGLKLMNPQD